MIYKGIYSGIYSVFMGAAASPTTMGGRIWCVYAWARLHGLQGLVRAHLWVGLQKSVFSTWYPWVCGCAPCFYVAVLKISRQKGLLPIIIKKGRDGSYGLLRRPIRYNTLIIRNTRIIRKRIYAILGGTLGLHQPPSNHHEFSPQPPEHYNASW